MRNMLKNGVEKPFLYSKNNIIVEVNNKFINFTGYSKNELIGKSLYEISCMLRINSQIYIENIQDENSCYIFTKLYQPREVTIYCKHLECEDEKMYLFKEKANSRIEDKFQVLNKILSNNKIGVGIGIYSASDSILLTANQFYLNILGKIYDEKEIYVSKKISEIADLWEGSKAKEVWMNVLNTEECFYEKEIKMQTKNCENYIDCSVTPVIKNGKVKYIISIIECVTEKVLLRKNSEKQVKVIRQQKEELEIIIENMSDGLSIIDKDYNFFSLNSSAEGFVYNPNRVKKVGDSLVHTKYYDSDGKLLNYDELPAARIINGEKLKEFEITSYRPDGIYHYNISGSPIYDEDGNIEKAIHCCRDVTERVNKDKLIREQKEMLEAILENMSESLVSFDKNGRFTKHNKVEFFKIGLLEDIDEVFKKFQLYDEYGNQILKENSLTKRVTRGEKISNCKIGIKVDNNLMHVEISGTPIYDNNGDFIMGILIIRDITNKMKSEETLLLKTQFDLLSNIIENLNIGFVRYSYPEFKVIDINNEAYSNLKQINPKVGPLSSLKGSDFCDIFNVNKKVEWTEIIQNFIEEKKGSYFNYVSGEEKTFKLMHQPLFGLNNLIVEIIVIVIDITDEVKARNKIEKALKMQEQIFVNVSHELKTPLNVIFSTNQLMDFYLKNNVIEVCKEKFFSNINIIKQNCYRFTKLINNIIDLSKIESGFFKLNLSNENIVQITEDIIQSISEYIKSKGVDILFDTNIEEKVIACDPEKIERIILNLISNAIKFSNSEGKISVTILDKGDIIEISVKDTGVGIAKEHLYDVFGRFYQEDKSLSRNAEGCGIGLSLVKSIVELHKGKISVESELGKGSIFKIELPARSIEELEVIEKIKPINSKIEMINIEFSDIYSI
jgi:PAS domain S-box-containing protein